MRNDRRQDSKLYQTGDITYMLSYMVFYKGEYYSLLLTCIVESNSLHNVYIFNKISSLKLKHKNE